MNRSYFALFVALLIHLLLMLVFWFLGSIAPDIKKPQKPKENRIKVSLKEMPKKEKKDAGEIEKVVKKEQIAAPPMPKGSQLKEIVKPAKKPPIKYEPKEIEAKKASQEKQHVKKPPINIPKEEIEIKQDSLKQDVQTPKIEPIPSPKPYIPFALEPPQKKE